MLESGSCGHSVLQTSALVIIIIIFNQSVTTIFMTNEIARSVSDRGKNGSVSSNCVNSFSTHQRISLCISKYF